MNLLGRARNSAAAFGFVALLVAFIGTVLVPGYRLANELSGNSAALKLASERRGLADSVAGSLGAIRDRLASGAYIGEAIDEIGGSIEDFDLALEQLQHSAAGDTQELRDAEARWTEYRKLLEPVAAFQGVPYLDSDTGGAQLNAGGRRLLEDTRRALQFNRTGAAQLTAAMTAIGARLEGDVAAGSSTLRGLMVAGVVFACLLVALLAYVQWLKARHERAAVEAQNQTRDILATVKDGLFLLDSDFRIGKAHSAALSTLLRREKFDGLTFEDLLRDLVPEKTLATATKYVKLLWGERANENLIRSINPLAEVEVQIDRGDGSRDAKYLEFEFHRVRGDEGIRQVLVTVNDVTSRVLLARELKESHESAQSQMDMLLGILHADPKQVTSFVDDAGAALGHINTVLKVPARNDRDFREKIDQLFREMHRIKGEAAVLGIVTVETRAHEFEDLLNELRQRDQLSGSDFLPLVVRLDELFNHLQSVRELVARLDGLRATALLSAAPAAPAASPASLGALAKRIAAENGKTIRLVAAGLDDVPDDYRKTLRDIVIQLVRNAVVHGIEPADTRRRLEKEETGVVQVQFKRTEGGYELLFQDDGAGIVAEHIRETAVARGVISAEEAQALDSKSALTLIFRPGFSTHGSSDRDAGRGVGLDLVRRMVQSLGGRISVATAPGKYTRFRVLVPAEQARQDAVA